MSIEIMFRLVCDGELCRRPFARHPEGRTERLERRDMESLRSQAHKAGWRRFRMTSTASMGDYCPQCVAERGIPSRRRPPVNGATRVQ